MAASPPTSLLLAPPLRDARGDGPGCLRWGAGPGWRKSPLSLQVRTQLGEAIHPRPVVEAMHDSFPLLLSS